MSHNPNTIDSQDELNTCNDGKRSSEVLLSTIDKIVEVEEWNKDMQAKYGNLSAELEKTKQQLDIAVKALDSLRGICFPERAEKALREIEELNK